MAEDGEGGGEDVEGAVDVGVELGAEFVGGLVFAGADDAVACAAGLLSACACLVGRRDGWRAYLATMSTFPQCSMLFLTTALTVSLTRTSHSMPKELSTIQLFISSMLVS